MEDLKFHALIFSLFVFLSYCFLRVFYTIWWKPKWLEKSLKQQGIKGTPYKPFIGDMKEYIKQITEAWSKPINLSHHIAGRVDPFTRNVVQHNGKTSFFWVGTTPRLIIMDPELTKEVLSNREGHIQKPAIKPPYTDFDKRINKFRSSATLIEKWKKLISRGGTFEIDIWPEFQDLTGDIISRTAFGSKYDEGKEILKLQKELQKLVIEAMQTLYIPGFRFIPTKKNRRRKYLDKKITLMLKALVERTENKMKTRETNDHNLLGLLLQSNNQNKRIGTKSNYMNMEEIIEECKLFYLAGHETTSSWLTWTMIVMAMHPNWQQKAREEVLQLCRDRDPDAEAIRHLKTVTMILYEVLRLYPPVIALYQHAYKETKIGNLSVQAGIDLTLPILLINRDPELWGDDAEEFKPGRFSEGVSKSSKDQTAFFPFGWGPRTCIGQNFAIIEAKIVLAMILKHFSFELSPSYTHAPYTVMTLQPQHEAQIILHPL
ncbi:Cytochrome [Abeliophyllum distichum]|uniref:Cytochrome n=1 Tax=Abeliophyllum distichum TaxID=126358 RepID=A0ABD1QVX6_9LAMI